MGSPRDLYNNIVVAEAVDASGTGSSFSSVTSFDRENSANPVHDLVLALVVGTVTTGDTTVTLVESDSTDVASAMDTVADGDVQGSNPLVLTTSNDEATHYLGYAGSKRYVGFTVDVTGSVEIDAKWVAADARDSIR